MLINGIKFACHTCVKGHRSSTCNHIERPLFEIRKKGRPVTQCSFCRDLRKTKQVHIKCTCKSKTTQQQQQQYHHCCPTEGGGITYPEIIQNSSINNTYDTQFYNRDWQPNTMDLSQPPDENLSRSRSSSSSLKSNPRKMSRKSSASSSRRSTISVPYNIPDMIPFNQQQQITELDSENSLSMVPKPNDTIYNGGLGGLTDPDELSFLLNNILMNRDESEKLGSLDMTRSTTTTSSTCSMPCIASPQGESVVITITPLSSSDMPVSRIVTCYCGSSCTCPGCFVHPTNYDKLLAPTNNQIISLPQPLTSCSSDEENPIY